MEPSDLFRKPFVIIESPYAGQVERNVRYARAAVRDCLQRGEVPFASHLFFTQVWNDLNAEERDLGIQAGFQIALRADYTVVYEDLGTSPGMELGIKHALDAGRTVTFRKIGKDWGRLVSK